MSYVKLAVYDPENYDSAADAVKSGALYDRIDEVYGASQAYDMIKQEEHVELRIAGEFIGEYPTYTQACEEVMRIVNQH